uniref:Lysozyme g n=1 Tax=Cyprinus carpio TaxID=7962 RepID=A0A8C2CVS7_CYPCA
MFIFHVFFLACIYGNIMKIDTTGASQATANQDRLNIIGVEASKKLAETDLARMEKYKSMITKVGREKQMDPAVIAAIISRQSRAGATLEDGWGDHGYAFGLISPNWGGYSKTGWKIQNRAWLPLIDRHMTRMHSFFLQINFRGISAYNAGVSTVSSYENIDARTSGKDFSNDVVARAQWFKSKGY